MNMNEYKENIISYFMKSHIIDTQNEKYKFISGLVSVIIPTYNRYELLNHCIKSVLANTYKDVEIIVINDCSTDDRYYSGQLEKYEKTIIIHLAENMRIKHNVQSAQGMTRNYGLEIAKGEWIAFLDDDDLFAKNKIETQLSRMKSNNFKFSSTNMYMINHNSITLDKLDFFIMRTYFKDGIPPVFNQKIICMTNYINNSSVIIHHSIVKQTGKLELIPHGHEDWYYWKRALVYTDCMYIDEPLVYYTSAVNNKKPIKYYV